MSKRIGEWRAKYSAYVFADERSECWSCQPVRRKPDHGEGNDGTYTDVKVSTENSQMQ